MDRTANIEKNRQHYDEIYSRIDIDAIVKKVSDVEAFLATASRTDTSWYGMYGGDFARRLAGKRVLELGCGDGLNALVMAALGANVVAIDISPPSATAIEEAASRLGLKNIEALSGDFSVMQWQDAEFDFVVGKAFLHHLTLELEEEYLRIIARVLKADGEARFVEPAVNSRALDAVRWAVPVPGRPSCFQRAAFRAWQEADANAVRDNSTRHYRTVGQRHFKKVTVTPYGSIERFARFLPAGERKKRFRQWAHRADRRLPRSLRHLLGRTQVAVYREPRCATGGKS